MNVLVISVYFLHPTATESTRFSSILVSPLTKHLQGIFKTGSDGMQDIQNNSWKEKIKPKIIPIIYKPHFFQSFAWALPGNSYRQTHITTAIWKETNKKTSRNASWKDFSKQQPNNLHIPQGKKIKPETKKKNKTTNKQTNKPQLKKTPEIMCYL